MRYKIKESNISKLATYLKSKTNEMVSNGYNKQKNNIKTN